MLNKRLITIMLAGAIATAITGGVVAAQTNDNSSKPFTAKVAATLGIDEISLQDAMKKAKQELFQERQAEAIASGKITQEQADAKLVWRDATPAERKAQRLTNLESQLAVAVAAGKITQEQADTKFAKAQMRSVGERDKGNRKHHKGKRSGKRGRR
jgi:hypothetical protein